MDDWDCQDSDDEYYDEDEDLGCFGDDDDIAFGGASSSTARSIVDSDCPKKNYTVLDEAEIRRRQNEDIEHISSVFSLSKAEASVLLCQYNWNVEKLHEEWFADEYSVRKKVGLIAEKAEGESEKENKTCGICFDEFEGDTAEMMRSLPCGHPYCITCWRGYISSGINERGSGALSLKCPGVKCGAAVTKDLIDELASEEERVKYYRYMVRSYVESRKEKTKWCPAPGCDHAVEFERGGGDQKGYVVKCGCSYSFCWYCREEAHRPVGCELVEKWILKNSSEAENTKWILAFSKPCPECNRPIEKNAGCMHMTCTDPCRYEFCWLCLGDWRNHQYGTCNRYKEEKLDQDERMRENAKVSLQRYVHYYERWASNHKSREKAIEDLERVQTNELTKLSDKVRTPTVQLNFIVEGWKQIIECRRVLKWTYAYGYYLEEREPAKKEFFEYLQGQAESFLERLHECAERELSPFLVDSSPNPNNDENTTAAETLELDFSTYRSKLVGLTKVTGKHFEELVRALENGLSDVVALAPAPSQGKDKGKKRKAAKPTSTRPVVVAANFDMDYGDFWMCDRCTFRNPVNVTACQMCYDQ